MLPARRSPTGARPLLSLCDLTAADVYLVPIGPTHYELYCESAEAEDFRTGGDAGRGGFYERVRRMVAEAQQERRARRLAAIPADPAVRPSWPLRLRNAIIGRVTEALAEWKLLWHLRKQTAADLVHPDDLAADRALAVARSSLQRDADRHRRRAILSVVAGAVLGPLLFFVPGPNLIAYYCWFLAVGHLLAWRGARHGLAEVDWRTRPNAPLAELRGILTLEPDARAGHIRDVTARLELDHLAAFVERMAARLR